MSFKRLDSEDFVFNIDSVAIPSWSNHSSSLVSFYTSSFQSSFSSRYYLDIYSSPNTSDNLENLNDIQFAIAYADSDGSGSVWYSPITPGQSPTRTVYGQFVNLLLGEDENTSFNFGGYNDSDYFFAIIINRSRYKQSIMPGSLQIRGLTGSDIYLTDNSRITPIVDYTPAGRRYSLGSGSFGDGVIPSSLLTTGQGIYGYLYPDVGIIILNPNAFSQEIIEGDPSAFVRGYNQNNNNPERLRYYLTQLTLQSEETIASNYMFCRARNAEFNYSTNPTFSPSFYSSSLNEYILTPATYITSVGMYNDNNELLAVAKLSKPLKKDFNSEALIRVKLDF
jgi:hypothetical protein